MKRSVFALLLALAINPVCAKALHPSIILEKITPIKTTEKSGDEIYINITEYWPDGKTKSTNIPAQPLAWASRDLAKLKALPLWNTQLAEGQSADVMMTFVEQDNPPYDPDDLLGIVQVKLINTAQGLKALWSVREGSVKARVKDVTDSDSLHFTLTGNRGTYAVDMKLLK